MRTRVIVGIVMAGSCITIGAKAQTNGTATSEPPRLPPIVVIGQKIREELPVGPYAQPEWTTHRRFPTTRVYLQDPPWNAEFEQWARWQNFRDGTSEFLFQEELTLGLPHRFQFDFYDNWTRDDDGYTEQDSLATELRYAFADWGKIPMNPTIYLEYKFGIDKTDAYEIKLLLGAELAPSWHWGVNVFVEQETRQEEETEVGASAALGYTVIDDRLNLGAEMAYEEATIKGERSDPERELLIGPSVQWRPRSRVHVDVVPLFGVTDDAPRVETYLVMGYDFGSIKKEGIAPKSTEGR
jgi:hypothetical protein